jgi:exonuclease VII large subunit
MNPSAAFDRTAPTFALVRQLVDDAEEALAEHAQHLADRLTELADRLEEKYQRVAAQRCQQSLTTGRDQVDRVRAELAGSVLELVGDVQPSTVAFVDRVDSVLDTVRRTESLLGETTSPVATSVLAR